MALLKEFKEFAMRGNVVDMAVGIIIGGAFGKIITSLVNDVVMPPLGVLIGGIDFTQKVITLRAATDIVPAMVLSYGKFINTVVDFVIVAAAIFLVVKAMNSMKKRAAAAPAAPAAPPADVQLLTEIRDLLKRK